MTLIYSHTVNEGQRAEKQSVGFRRKQILISFFLHFELIDYNITITN